MMLLSIRREEAVHDETVHTRLKYRDPFDRLVCVSFSGSEVRRVMNELGLLFIVVFIAENSYHLFSTLFERATHLRLVTGFSRGVCLFSLWSLLVTQLASTLILLTPAVYKATGHIVPSVLLTTGVLLETVAFGDLADATTALAMLCFSGATALVAVFRHDRQQRDTAMQLPTDGILLRIQEKVCVLCTLASTGLVCPPMVVICIYSALSNAFWNARPALAEYTRSRHKLALAAAAALVLVSAQDKESLKKIARAATRSWKELCLCAERVAVRTSRKYHPMGDKKHL